MYAKIIDNRIELPPINKTLESSTIFNYSSNNLMLEEDGYSIFLESEIDGYNIGTHKVINNELRDISKTQEYIAEQEEKQKDIQDKKTITKRQLWFWLFQKKGIEKESIPAVIQSIQDPTNKYLASASYEGTDIFEYGNPFVSIIGKALGLTTADLIKCFDEAPSL